MSWIIWSAFLLFVAAMVLLDLGVFHRQAHAVRLKEAAAWTAAWILLALFFNALVYVLYEGAAEWMGLVASGGISGSEAATQFFTGYVLEKSLSVDNIFVIAMIFAYFQVPQNQQHRLLFWGILGAVILRGVMILIGAALIERFSWLTFIFGGLLLASAVKMLLTRHDSLEPENNAAVRLVRRIMPVASQYHAGRFLIRRDGRLTATPLLLALVMVETSDVLFAVDSIPAVFAVTRDPFLIFTSNIFAILGLRSMYFVLDGFMARFRYLKVCLVFVLAYVGVKMLLSHHYPIPNLISLAIIGGILAVGAAASLLAGRAPAAFHAPPNQLKPGEPPQKH